MEDPCQGASTAAKADSIVELLAERMLVGHVQIRDEDGGRLGLVTVSGVKSLQPLRRFPGERQRFIAMAFEPLEDHSIVSGLRHPQERRSIRRSRCERGTNELFGDLKVPL